ncbi:hypothetical protein [Hymenobacter ruricola]|uniref:Uncharacterized protein n=1 Tax=Hymenobacter ruricola TaxID=2791023 RepID=A0ABS0I349_9BACT|nr:hypothetical protein [Hymenobacter ruricola]MBF9221027.1 hypothetical protein [Hymenobacter ruricola]
MFLPFLKNPFSTKKMAREDFRDLMAANLDRMSGQNQEGQYSAMISALQPHHDAYAAFLGDQDEHVGERLGNTDAVEKILAGFKLFAKKELLVDVAYIFGRKAPDDKALAAFLPAGRGEYSGATLKTLPTLLERAATLTAKYEDQLGKDLAQKAEKFKQDYDDDRRTQGASKGAVQGDSKEEKKLRKAAARQLKLNLLGQLTLHVDEPDAVKALYDPKIFTQPKPGTAPDAAA